MVYSINNNIAAINGITGIYDNKINNPSVRYGRNASANNFEYLNALKGKPIDKTKAVQFNPTNSSNLLQQQKANNQNDQFIKENDEYLKSLPPLDFELQYMPDGANGKNIDKMALLGAAFEEMGKKVSMPVQELTEKLKLAFKDASANALDVNKDGKIDISEYSTSILASDMLSTNTNELNAQNINGKINKNGLNNLMAYANTKNETVASKTFTDIHKAYGLEEAQKAFLNDTNNTLDIMA